MDELDVAELDEALVECPPAVEFAAAWALVMVPTRLRLRPSTGVDA